MRTLLLRALLGLTIAIVICAAVLAIALQRISPEQFRAGIAAQLSLRLGLEIRIDGALQFEPGLRPRLVLRSVIASSPFARFERPVCRFDRIELSFDVWRVISRRELVLEGVEVDGAEVWLLRDEDGATNWRPHRLALQDERPEASGGVVYGVDSSQLHDAHVTYRDLQAGVEIELALEHVRQRLNPDGHTLELEAVGSLNQNALVVQGVVERLSLPGGASVLFASGRYRLRVNARVADAELAVTGELDDPRSLARIELETTLQAPSLDRLARILMLDPPLGSDRLGPLRLQGRLEGGQEAAGGLSLALREVELELGRIGATDRLRATGAIAELTRLGGLDLALVLESGEADAWLELVGRTPLGFARARASGRLRGRPAALELSDLDVVLDHAAGSVIGLVGTLGWQNERLALDLEAELLADSLEAGIAIVERLTPSDPIVVPPSIHRLFGPLGPVALRAHLVGDADGLAGEQISAEIGLEGSDWLRARGTASALLSRSRDLELDVSLATEDLQGLLRRAELPALQLDRARAQLVLRYQGERVSVHQLQLVARQGERVEVGLSGEIPDVTQLAGREVALAVHALDLAALGSVVDRVLPAIGPIDARARMIAEPGRVRVGDSQLRIGQSEFAGDVDVRWSAGQRPSLVSRVRSSSLRLEDLGIAPEPRTEDQVESSAANVDLDRELPFDDLLRIDASLEIALDRVQGREGFELRDVGVTLLLQDGVLSSEDLEIELESGRVSIAGRVDAAMSPPEASLRLHARGLSLERLLAQIREQESMSGELELSLDLASRGRTPRALIEGLAGDVLMHARQGRVSTRYSRALEIEILGRLDPDAEARQHEKLNCLIVDLSIAAGQVAIESLLFDSDVKQVIGSGEIDLVRRRLRVVLTPAFKKTIPGSVTAAVQISGPIDDPLVVPEPFSTASAATKGLIERALRPARRYLPGVSGVLDGIARTAGRAADATGMPRPARQLWDPGVDISCESILELERIARARAPAWRRSE